MASTFLSLHYHLVFGTHERRPLIRVEWRTRFHEYLGGVVRGLGGIPEAVGGVEDHIHLLVGLRATHCLADFVRELKKASSLWAKEHGDPEFKWQDGYAAFTVGATSREPVKRYIGRQEEHHHTLGFREELEDMLCRAGVEYQPDYLP